jgi:predicted metal-dependent HD superfamily phosphohydrolase
MFEENYKQILSELTTNPQLPSQYVEEVKAQHQKKGRYYHTFYHLESIWMQLQPVKETISDWPVLVCAIAYHDFQYNTLKNDNEEKSALIAVKKLSVLQLNAEQITRCRQHILATKGHQVSADADTNYFTDADLSILGADAESYRSYANNIRKEYRYYPDLIYKPGRRKVLDFFLQMPRIFKTGHFFALYESNARRNLAQELLTLNDNS